MQFMHENNDKVFFKAVQKNNLYLKNHIKLAYIDFVFVINNN